MKRNIQNMRYLSLLCRRMIWLGAAIFISFGCKPKGQAEDSDQKVNTITPVTLVSPENGNISDYLELNATSSFLRKETIKSTANGYISDVKIALGDVVHKGQVLFTIQTKESKALANYKNTYDTSIHFTGLIPIASNKDGVVSAISHQKGEYVQDADQLAIVAEQSSLIFMINAPYEYHKYLSRNKQVTIVLPDGEKPQGTIESDLPVMDVNSQTQNYVVKPLVGSRIPEGLIARVRIKKEEKSNAVTLPKAAVLSDEKEENFWVMKMLNDSTAIKLPVKLGMQNADEEEIIEPKLSPQDRIILTGAYGLSDTARVEIQK